MSSRETGFRSRAGSSHGGRLRVALVIGVAAAVAAASGWASPLGASGDAPPPKVKSGATSHRSAATNETRVGIAASGATNIGFCGGDDWEPETTAAPDGVHVYVVWTHFPGDTSCDRASGNANRVYIRASSDGGKTFGPAHVVANRIGGVDYPQQVDNVVTVDPASGTVYVSFLAYGLGGSKTDVAVARSTDFGAHFSAVKVNGPLCANCDHPWTIAYGRNVYSAYAHGGEHFLSRSSDRGRSWIEVRVLKADRVAFPEGAVLDAHHNAYFAWGDCRIGSCKGKDAGRYRVSRTTAGSSKTTFSEVATAPGGPRCPYSPSCGFAYFGIQNDIAIDSAGTLYVVWQDGQDHTTAGSPPIVQLSRSSDHGKTWTHVGRVDDKTATGCAASECYALFPRVEGGGPGQIAAMWMDDRLGLPVDHRNGWNVWLRTSVNGGTSWAGPGRRVSTFDPQRVQSEPNGFRFPYGDYEGIDLVTTGASTQAVMIWGEGIDYTGGATNPGVIVYRRVTL